MSVVFWLLTCLLLLLAICWLWTLRLAAGAENTVPPAGQILPVSGGAIHYTDEGPRDGQTLVLIHGLAGTMHNLTYALAGQLSSDFRVITIDRPGSGYSTRIRDDLAQLPAQARMVCEFLDKLGVQNPVLVGHSLGGALALAMVMECKRPIGALALLAPLAAVIPEPPAVFRSLVVVSAFLRRLIGHTVAAPIAKLTSEKVLAQVFAPEKAPGDFKVRGGGILGLRPASFISASADLLGATASMSDQVARYAAELDVPGGILFGTDDRLLSPDVHGRAMQAYGLHCETLPGRGHMIPVTAPEACADFIRRMAAMAG
ncbi:alpha/beta hydrolase [Hoeflea sp. AS60]|uniref:alpha/beta fold hydrolase n=1 Tax=Hoeflea sp. AS60 TaxID=3135780 RepID=UPI003177617E